MSSPVITIDVDAKVIDAAKIMARKKIGSIIIMEGDKAVGIVTERDLLERVLGEGKDPSQVVMREVMSSPLIFLGKSSPILEALRMMRRHDIRRLAVIEGDQLVGIVTDKDILKAVATLALVSFRPLLEI
jgi:CBS domain-containing protein